MPSFTPSSVARATLGIVALALTLVACSSGIPPLRGELQPAAAKHDAVALSEALEILIDAQTATDDDREAAYHAVSSWPEQPTAAYHFGRAAITGRLAQVRGLSAIGLVGEVETHARKSIELDPSFQDGAATRMLGTLYVLAPASLVDYGDSETGLELLEGLVDKYPSQPENHLRVAEAYIALGDPEPAHEPLCVAFRERAKLHADDQRLLDRLIDGEGGMAALGCPAPPVASAPPAATTVPAAPPASTATSPPTPPSSAAPTSAPTATPAAPDAAKPPKSTATPEPSHD